MITDGEWEAIKWYFKLYSQISYLPVIFDSRKKKITLVTSRKHLRRVFLTWFTYQFFLLIVWSGIYIFRTQPETVSVEEILFSAFYNFVFFTSVIPSYVMARTPQVTELLFKFMHVAEGHIVGELHSYIHRI